MNTEPSFAGAASGPPPQVPAVQAARPSGSKVVPIVVTLGMAAVLAAGGYLLWRSESRTDKVALADAPKPVTVTLAQARDFRPSRLYVGTLEPWLSANVGPQLVSAYVDTLLVRPGAVVKRGEVLATLDCRDASAASQGVAMEARAIDARQKALAIESARLRSLVAGQFVSANEAEQKTALSSAEDAQLQAMKAKLARTTLNVDDCVLHAPFDGEIATRAVDPGAFVRPGVALVTVVDRSTVRLSADAPEVDFAVVAPGRAVRIHLTATNEDLLGTIARRSPSADPSTRTVHFEVDLPDPARGMPVGTTGEAQIDVGAPQPATALPIYAAAVRGKTATVFVIEDGVAKLRKLALLGEIGGTLFVDPSLKPGAHVVVEGRAILNNGDRVSEQVEKPQAASAVAPADATATEAAP